MDDRPTLSNGYLWVCNAAMSAARAGHIERGLDGIRCQLRIRDNSALGYPHVAATVELWVHPDDDDRVHELWKSLPDDL